MSLSLGELYVTLSSRTGPFESGMSRADSMMSRLERRAGHFMANLARRSGAALLVIAAFTTRWSMKFGEALELSNTMLKMGQDELAIFGKGILALSDTYGKSATEIANSAYKISSVLHTNARDTLTILAATTAAAKAGKIEVTKANESVVTMMSIYGIAAEDAIRVTDILAATVREGNANWQDVANVLPRIAAIAKPLGISLEEVGGAFAYVSGQSGTAREAGVSLRNLFMSILKPTPRMKVALADLAKAFGMQEGTSAKMMIKAQGLGAVMEALGVYIGEDTDLLTKMVPGMRSITGAVAVFSNANKGVNQALRGVIASEGELMAQIEAGLGPIDRISMAWNRLKNMLIRAFISTEPVVVKWMETFGRWASSFTGFSQETVSRVEAIAVKAFRFLMLVGRGVANLAGIVAANSEYLVSLGLTWASCKILFMLPALFGKVMPLIVGTAKALVSLAVAQKVATGTSLALHGALVSLSGGAIRAGIMLIVFELWELVRASKKAQDEIENMRARGDVVTGEYTKKGLWNGVKNFVKAQTGWMTFGMYDWGDWEEGSVMEVRPAPLPKKDKSSLENLDSMWEKWKNELEATEGKINALLGAPGETIAGIPGRGSDETFLGDFEDDWREAFFQIESDADEAIDSLVDVAEVGGEIAEVGEKINRSWSGVGAAIKGSIAAYTTVAQYTSQAFMDRLRLEQIMNNPGFVPGLEGGGGMPASAVLAPQTPSGESGQQNLQVQRDMLSELRDIRRGIDMLAGCWVSEAQVIGR